ncbi:hypothetical protein SO574_19145 [Vibrio alfacsensis]|uniref:hypothetical protein n=1 Tax=Vibrio alfacsensis TaxID=1074311 RepID=UPI002ADD6C08|nr:hypothetical protein [Vibrio alfacsensis]WQE77889.1 hypothetical protein SO574_19145 [Vibrio alfacsensis]
MNQLKTSYKPLALMCLFALSMNANAAKVDTKVKYIGADYGTSYDYTGYKAEVTMSPNDSNWYYLVDAREYNHKSGADYTRFGFGVGHKFLISGGYIQPEFVLRSEKNDYGVKASDGSRGNVVETDYKVLETMYQYEFIEWGKLAGKFKLIHSVTDEISGSGIKKTYERYINELEPALRLHPFKPFDTFKKTSLENLTVNLIYYSIDNTNTNGGVGGGGTYDLDGTIHNRQFRAEVTYKNGPFTITPYTRLPLVWAEGAMYYNSNNLVDGNSERYKLTRLGVKGAYAINKKLSIIGEFYSEDKEFKEGYQHDLSRSPESNTKVVELGIHYKF